MVKLIRAQPEQSNHLQRLARRSKQHWGYGQNYMRLWNHDQTITADFIAQNPVYCAMDGKSVAGFYALELSPEICELKHLWVCPSYIGQGIGKRLLTHLVDLLAEVGVTPCKIVAEPHAEGFYARMGAVRMGQKFMPALDQKLPIMRLDISCLVRKDAKLQL